MNKDVYIKKRNFYCIHKLHVVMTVGKLISVTAPQRSLQNNWVLDGTVQWHDRWSL